MRTKQPQKQKRPSPDTMCYIGIDFSINSPGVSISFADVVITHVFNFESLIVLKPVERWDTLTDQIVSYILRHGGIFKSTIFIEDYAMGGKGRTNDIAECCGLLKFKLYKVGLSLDQLKFVSIAHLKQFVAGIGNAKKELMLKEVFKKWGYDTNDNNAADAYAIMKVCRAFHNVEKVTADQKKIMAKIITYNTPKKKKKK